MMVLPLCFSCILLVPNHGPAMQYFQKMIETISANWNETENPKQNAGQFNSWRQEQIKTQQEEQSQYRTL
jgi:hypothetical protein